MRTQTSTGAVAPSAASTRSMVPPPCGGAEGGEDRRRQAAGVLVARLARDPGVDAPRCRVVGPDRLGEGRRLAEPGAGDDRRDRHVEPGGERFDQTRPDELVVQRRRRQRRTTTAGRQLSAHRRAAYPRFAQLWSDSPSERAGVTARLCRPRCSPMGTERMKLYLATAVGRGGTELAAFDAALVGAGVANFNLIRLSSVIPPNGEIVEVDRCPFAAGRCLG